MHVYQRRQLEPEMIVAFQVVRKNAATWNMALDYSGQLMVWRQVEAYMSSMEAVSPNPEVWGRIRPIIAENQPLLGDLIVEARKLGDAYAALATATGSLPS